MARSALQKLQDANRAIDALESSTSVDEVQVHFAEAANALKAAYDKIPVEAIAAVKGRSDAKRQKARQREWWVAEQRAARDDELISWVFAARNDDQHVPIDEERLVVGADSYIEHLETSVGADEALVIGPDGPWRITGQGTPHERRSREPFRGRVTLVTTLHDGPSTHRGAPVADQTPAGVLRLAHSYLADLWTRSRQNVGS
ncbi:hypothetical protein [Georgenia wangjunii]|uniref:hypothetical protein n=1 Tax=Georgenia wangjunii TaxID=3117730 RepID=UPI002F261331